MPAAMHWRDASGMPRILQLSPYACLFNSHWSQRDV